jgi:predicted dehydrogenase
MKKKVAFIGGGIDSVVGRAHYAALHLDGKFDLKFGIFSKNKYISTQTEKIFNLEKTSIDSLSKFIQKCKSDKIDLVVILSPSPLHYNHIKSCLDAGISVICEKPVVTKLEDLRKIDVLLNNKKVFFASVFNYACYPMIIEMREMIRKKIIGNIQQLHISMPQEGFISQKVAAGEVRVPQAWRLKEKKIFNIFLDLGTHISYLIKFITNLKPKKVKAISRNFSKFKNISDNIFFWLDFPNKIIGNCWISKTAAGSSNDLSIKIYGSKGSLIWHHKKPEQIIFSNILGEKKIIERRSFLLKANNLDFNRFKAGHLEGFIEAYANFYIKISREFDFYKKNKKYSKNYFFTFDNAKEGLFLGDALSKSVQYNSKWIKIRSKV